MGVSRQLVTLAFTFLCIANSLFGQTTPISSDDLLTLKSIGSLTLSPDGRHVAFVQDGTVWVLPTLRASVPRRIGPGSGPIWAPTGDGLAFFAPSETTGGLQIFTHDLVAGTTRQATRVDGGIFPDRIGWSSRNQLVFVAQVPLAASKTAAGNVPDTASAERGTPLILHRDTPDGYALAGIITGVSGPQSQVIEHVTELFVHDIATGETKQLTHDGLGYMNPVWSPDGRSIVCASQEGRGLGVFETALYAINTETGQHTRLVSAGDTKKIEPIFSPDGTRVAYAYHSFTDASVHGLAVLDVRATDPMPTVIHSALVLAHAWSADGHALITIHNEDVRQPVIEINIDTRDVQTIGSIDHVASSSSLTVSNTGAVAWVESHGDRPAVLMIRRSGEEETEELFDPNPQVGDWSLGAQEIVRWTNRHGHERTGILIKPVGFRAGTQYPLIISAYSQGTHLNGFQQITHPGYANQIFASRGYAVFFPCPRLPWMYGSLARSEAEAESLRGAEGWDVTVDDVESGVDLLIERGIVDPERMAVIGHSNGGAVATALVTSTTRYRAAVAIAPANLNWVDNELYRDDTAGRWLTGGEFTGIGVALFDNPSAYMQGSLVFRAQHIKTPMLLAVGDSDHTSFTLPTVQLYLALRGAGKEVTLLRYADVGHSFFGPAATDLSKRIATFLDERLAMTR